MNELELCTMPAIRMRDAIKAKKLSPIEVMEAILRRIDRLNPKINAYCTVAYDSAMNGAKQAEDMVMKSMDLGPLHGVPVSIKDLIFTKGIRTVGGTKMYENFIPEHDAICVERLKVAGAIIVGKTNTPQSGWVAITDNLVFGATRNPWNVERTSGGSSGGAASSVAACMAPLAIGSDGGGSIRIPSNFCGVFGHKPSYGRVPMGPGFPGLWEGLSVTGPITRTVRDAALMMEVIAGRDDRDYHSLQDIKLEFLKTIDSDLKGTRVAWSPDLGYAIVDPEVLRITETAVGTFSTLGCDIETTTPDVDSPQIAFSTQTAASIAASLHDKLQEWRDNFEPALARFIEESSGILAIDYVKARMQQLEYSESIRHFFERYDFLLTPVTAVPAFEIGIYSPREIAGEKVSPLGWMPFTYPFNVTGQPAASVPCGWTSDGLPVGLQIIGRRFDDAGVLKVAATFEEAMPWVNTLPPLE